MKERIMGKGSIKGRLGKDDRAAETKDPTDKSCLAHTFYRKTHQYSLGEMLDAHACIQIDNTIKTTTKQTSTFCSNPDVSHNPRDRRLGS